MAREDGAGEVVEPLATAAALIAPTLGLGVVAAIPDDRGRFAGGAGDAIGSPHITDGLEALGVVEEVLDIHHDGASQVHSRQQRSKMPEALDPSGSVCRTPQHPGNRIEPREITTRLV